MDFHNQADGFYDEGRLLGGKCSHPECVPLEECCHPLAPDRNSGKGRNVSTPEPDVWQLTHNRSHFRLARGFNMLLGSER